MPAACAAKDLFPAVLYGAGLAPITISVDPKQMKRILGSESGHNSIFDLSAGGDAGKAMIVDWQADPVKGACCTSTSSALPWTCCCASAFRSCSRAKRRA